MIKINRFSLGKGKKKNCYNGISITFLWFKLERIGFKNHFMWRFEFTNWSE